MRWVLLGVSGRDWGLAKGSGWVYSLTTPLCSPPHRSLGLVLPPYSTYYIQANLSDQILQVKCK